MGGTVHFCTRTLWILYFIDSALMYNLTYLNFVKNTDIHSSVVSFRWGNFEEFPQNDYKTMPSQKCQAGLVLLLSQHDYLRKDWIFCGKSANTYCFLIDFLQNDKCACAVKNLIMPAKRVLLFSKFIYIFSVFEAWSWSDSKKPLPTIECFPQSYRDETWPSLPQQILTKLTI